MEPVSFVKVQPPGSKGWWFVSTGDKLNRLRIHAVQFTPQAAREAVRDILADNPGYHAKATR